MNWRKVINIAGATIVAFFIAIILLVLGMVAMAIISLYR